MYLMQIFKDILSNMIDKKITAIKIGKIGETETMIMELDNSSFISISGSKLGPDIWVNPIKQVPIDFKLVFQITNQKV